MKIAVIRSKELKDETSMLLAIRRVGLEPEVFYWGEHPEHIKDKSGYVIEEGFSFDDSMGANLVAHFDPIMSILKEQSELGKPILGVGTGSQLLIESGLIPGVENNKISLALKQRSRNDDKEVVALKLSKNYQYNAFTRSVKPLEILTVPQSDSVGQFVIPLGLKFEMEENGLFVFEFCNAEGKVLNNDLLTLAHPMSIAAISNKAGNVMAILPAIDRSTACDAILLSMREAILSPSFQKVAPLHYYPRFHSYQKYVKKYKELIVSDSQAVELQILIDRLHLPLKIKKFIHWEIDSSLEDEIETIIQSGILINRGEEVLSKEREFLPSEKLILVQAKEDNIGANKLKLLKQELGLTKIEHLRYGVLWSLEGDPAIIQTLLHKSQLWNRVLYEVRYF